MAKLSNYNGTIELVTGITQKNNGDFPLAQAADIMVENNGKRLDVKLDELSNRISKIDTIGDELALSIIPVGSIIPWLGNSVPENFKRLDGSSLSRTTYSNLFNAIGTKYGDGDGKTTFNLPNENLNPYNIDEDNIPMYSYIIRVI